MGFPTGKAGDALPEIIGCGSEVQLELCLESQRLDLKLQDGKWLERSRDGKKGKWGPVQCLLLLPKQDFQAPTEM